MTTATLPAPKVPDTDDGDDLTHLVCCDEDRALCGADVAGCEDVGVVDAAPDVCAMCELEWNEGLPCGPSCGRGKP